MLSIFVLLLLFILCLGYDIYSFIVKFRYTLYTCMAFINNVLPALVCIKVY